MEISSLTIDSLPKVTDVEFLETGSPNSLLFGLLGLLFVGVVQAVYLTWQVQKESAQSPSSICSVKPFCKAN
jgi:hypothetical protein